MVIRLSAVRVLLVAICVAACGETAPTSPNLGSTDWPATAGKGPNLDLISEKPHAVTKPTRTTRKGYIQIDVGDDDYEYYEGEEPTDKAIVPGPMDRCDYNPCAHMQVPCVELQLASSCLCPGISGEGVVPEQPRMQETTGVSDSTAVVHWCEPLSVVDDYRLVFRPLDGAAADNVTTQLIQSRARVFALNSLVPGTSYVVCAVASNRAGSSRLGERDVGAAPGFGPCVTFKTTSARALMRHIAIAVTLLLLLVVTCVLLRCFCTRRQKAASHDSSASPPLSIGLQNPTYENDKAIPLPS